MDTATTPLMEDYMYGAGAGGPLTETISGLGNLIGYKLTIYIYAAGDASGQGSLITLGGTGISDTGATAVTTGANRKLSSGVGVAYQVFTGTITGSSFTITQDKNPGQTGSNGFLNGLQLDVAAVPEPSTYAMMLGGLGVLFALTGFRRLRTNA